MNTHVVPSVDCDLPGVAFAGRRSRERHRRPPWRAQPVSIAQPALSIQTIGPVAISWNGEALPLPASRKTRALLGYLVLCARPQRRERLCELLWEVPDDPRAALRWSLSKLRPLVNVGGETRLIADREQVRIQIDPVRVDFEHIAAVASGEEAVGEDTTAHGLAEAWECANRVLMEDCELSNQPTFSAWLDHKRTELVRLRVKLARRLAQAPDLSLEESEVWAERWWLDAPFDPAAAQHAVLARRKLGREREAVALADQMERAFRDAGLEPPDFSICPFEVAPATGPAAGPPHADAARVPARVAPATLDSGPSIAPEAADGPAVPHQSIRFTEAQDGVSLAWAVAGDKEHPALLKAGTWPSHLELDWGAPIWSGLYRSLTDSFRFIRYDERGCGLSDWMVPEISLARSVGDLERVVDAAGLDRFPLLGMSHGAAAAITYAARHPERVSHLVLVGGFAAGWRHTASAEEVREREAVMVLAERGWGRTNPSYRHLLSQTLMPSATAEDLAEFDAVQRRTTSTENVMRVFDMISTIDVRPLLKDVRAATLVLHSRNDIYVPVGAGRALAAQIPNAEFAGLDSDNHFLLGREPATADLVAAVRRFLGR